MKNPGVVIIGSGFAGLSAACFLAKAGKRVTVLEQHDMPGGRARQFKSDGFTFDMGPSWYWMPDVMERFFGQFGKSASGYFSLQRLDPSYRVFWQDGPMDIPADYEALRDLFEKLEPGSGPRLDAFLKEAAFKYSIGMKKLAYKPGKSLLEFADMELMKGLFRLDVFTSVKTHIGRRFQHPKLRQLLEFPMLFLGALPEDTPALYTLMNHADIKLGTWYPSGGMYSLVQAMYDLAVSLGVEFCFNHRVQKLEINQCKIGRVLTEKSAFEAAAVVSNADYHFTETQLLEKEHRSYSDKYWQQRTMAPSCLIFFVGLNKRVEHLLHHSLFFDVPFDKHAAEIYRHPSWPEAPLLYVSCTSKTDEGTAPPGCENLFILIPLAAGLQGDTEAVRQRYFDLVLRRLEQHTGENIKGAIVFSRSYAQADFERDYHAFKGNAYGLANPLWQTANLKPSIRSKKVKNLFYTGQLTVPGPGVPPSIISGEIVAGEVCGMLG